MEIIIFEFNRSEFFFFFEICHNEISINNNRKEHYLQNFILCLYINIDFSNIITYIVITLIYFFG